MRVCVVDAISTASGKLAQVFQGWFYVCETRPPILTKPCGLSLILFAIYAFKSFRGRETMRGGLSGIYQRKHEGVKIKKNER